MATKTITPATASFILSEGEGSISRDTVVIVAGQDLLAGTVLGKITASGKYAAHDPSAITGVESAVAVLYAACDATAADQKAVIVNKLAEVANVALTWHGDITGPQTTTALAKLAEREVIVR